MKKIFFVIFVLSSCNSINEIEISDVSSFKEFTDTTISLASNLFENNVVSKMLIRRDSFVEIRSDGLDEKKIYFKEKGLSINRVWEKSIILEDIDSVVGLTNNELTTLKKNLHDLYTKYNIKLISSKISRLDTSMSNTIYYDLKDPHGDYYTYRCLSFLSPNDTNSYWFSSAFEIFDNKDGLFLFGHKCYKCNK